MPIVNKFKVNNQIYEIQDSRLDNLTPSSITPQLFGAIGDGVADDSQAFQDALDYCGLTGNDLIVPTSNCEKYLITKTLFIPRAYKLGHNRLCTIKGTNLSGKGSRSALDHGIFFQLDKNNNAINGWNGPQVDCLFYITNEALRIENLHIKALGDESDAQTGTICFYIHPEIENLDNTYTCSEKVKLATPDIANSKKIAYPNLDVHADVDLGIIHCTANHFDTIFDMCGRGLTVKDCGFGKSNIVLRGNWATFPKDTNHPSMYQQRGYCFQNNRIHKIIKNIIKMESGNAYGLIFTSNLIDNGQCRDNIIYCKDKALNWNISGNIFQGCLVEDTTSSAFHFCNGVKNCIFSNNIVDYNEHYWDVNGTPTLREYFKFGAAGQSGDVDGLIISNNTFYSDIPSTPVSRFIYMWVGDNFKSNITGNIFNNISNIFTKHSTSTCSTASSIIENNIIN